MICPLWYKITIDFFLVEMVTAMKTVASLDVELTVEERNLLSVAYKNVIGARRASWRIISSIEQKEESKASEDKLKMIKTYRNQVNECMLTFIFITYIIQDDDDDSSLAALVKVGVTISNFLRRVRIFPLSCQIMTNVKISCTCLCRDNSWIFITPSCWIRKPCYGCY